MMGTWLKTFAKKASLAFDVIPAWRLACKSSYFGRATYCSSQILQESHLAKRKKKKFRINDGLGWADKTTKTLVSAFQLSIF